MSTTKDDKKSKRNFPPKRKKVRARDRKQEKKKSVVKTSLEKRIEKKRKAKENRKDKKFIKDNYQSLKNMVLDLISKDEVEKLAFETGFTKRETKKIKPFIFVVCCTLAAVIDQKRGFASIWRLINAGAGVVVARSAVTQRFGKSSSNLLKRLWEIVSEKVRVAKIPEIQERLSEFMKVLAHDGSVLKVSPLLKKLFPATRTNSVQSAAKLHGTADVINRRFVKAIITGERKSELAVAREIGIEKRVLYLFDLGYTSYDYYVEIRDGEADFAARLKSNANPTIVNIRHGIRAPKNTISKKMGLNHKDLYCTKCHDSFDLDAEFKTNYGCETFRVVGIYNKSEDKYHTYVTTLSHEEFTPDDIAQIYRLRWTIEILFKLLKSSCHLDHLDTKNPDALRTLIYSSLLASTILSVLCYSVASVYNVDAAEISPLIVGISAPIIFTMLMLLWLKDEPSTEDLAQSIFQLIMFGCRDPNPKRTKKARGI